MPWRLHLDVRSACGSPQALALCGALLLAQPLITQAASTSRLGIASWYGEAERGKLMANGKPFNPDTLTAACWFYPMGTRLQVSLRTTGGPRTVIVTVTDRGPALRLVKEGRIIDLSRTAFARLAGPERGLIQVSIRRIDEQLEREAAWSPGKGASIKPPKEAPVATLPGQAATFVRFAPEVLSKIELPKDKIFCMDRSSDSLYEATIAGSGSPLCHRHSDR